MSGAHYADQELSCFPEHFSILMECHSNEAIFLDGKFRYFVDSL